MGGDQNRFPLPHSRIKDAARTQCQRKKIFPPRGLFDPLPLYPVGPIPRESNGNLRTGQPLPQAEVALTEFRHHRNRNLPLLPPSDSLRRVGRSSQVACVDQIQRNIRQAVGQCLRLPHSPGIQGHIGLALDPVVLIPLGLAVANQIND
jgi:hypothetical protein